MSFFRRFDVGGDAGEYVDDGIDDRIKIVRVMGIPDINVKSTRFF